MFSLTESCLVVVIDWLQCVTSTLCCYKNHTMMVLERTCKKTVSLSQQHKLVQCQNHQLLHVNSLKIKHQYCDLQLSCSIFKHNQQQMSFYFTDLYILCICHWRRYITMVKNVLKIWSTLLLFLCKIFDTFYIM